jgi:hypothetical protein
MSEIAFDGSIVISNGAAERDCLEQENQIRTG